jgi:hypothetical protein
LNAINSRADALCGFAKNQLDTRRQNRWPCALAFGSCFFWQLWVNREVTFVCMAFGDVFELRIPSIRVNYLHIIGVFTNTGLRETFFFAD